MKNIGFFPWAGWLQIFPQQPFRKVIHVHHPTSGAKRIKNDSVYLLGLYKKTRSCLGRFFFWVVCKLIRQPKNTKLVYVNCGPFDPKNRTCEFPFPMSGIDEKHWVFSMSWVTWNLPPTAIQKSDPCTSPHKWSKKDQKWQHLPFGFIQKDSFVLGRFFFWVVCKLIRQPKNTNWGYVNCGPVKRNNRTCEFCFPMSGIDEKHWVFSMSWVTPNLPPTAVQTSDPCTSPHKWSKKDQKWQSLPFAFIQKNTFVFRTFFFLGGVQADSSTQEHQIGLC